MNFAQGKDLFIFIKGNIFNFHSSVHKKAEEKLLILTESFKEKFDYIVVHQSPSELNPLIKKFKKNEMDHYNRVILMAHSWGVAASYHLVKELAKHTKFKNFPLLISLDAVRNYHPTAIGRDGKVEFAPEQIETVLNFYENQYDAWFYFGKLIQGYPDIKRLDKSYSGIENQHIVLDEDDSKFLDNYGRVNLHDGLILELIDNGNISSILNGFY